MLFHTCLYLFPLTTAKLLYRDNFGLHSLCAPHHPFLSKLKYPFLIVPEMSTLFLSTMILLYLCEYFQNVLFMLVVV